MDFDDGLDGDFGADVDSSSFDATPEESFGVDLEETPVLEEDVSSFEPDEINLEYETSSTETFEEESLESETLDIEPGKIDVEPGPESFETPEIESLEPEPLDLDGEATDFNPDLHSVESLEEMEILEPEPFETDLITEPDPIPSEIPDLEPLELEPLDVESGEIEVEPEPEPVNEVESLEPETIDLEREATDFDANLHAIEPLEETEILEPEPFETDFDIEPSPVPSNILDVEPLDVEPGEIEVDPELFELEREVTDINPDRYSTEPLEERGISELEPLDAEPETAPENVFQPNPELVPGEELLPEREAQPEFEAPLEEETDPQFENAPELDFTPDTEWSSDRETAPDGERKPDVDTRPEIERLPETDFMSEDTFSLERDIPSETENIPPSEPETSRPEGEPTFHEGMGEYPGMIGPEQTPIYHSPEPTPETEPDFGSDPMCFVPPDTTDAPEDEPAQSLGSEDEDGLASEDAPVLPEEDNEERKPINYRYANDTYLFDPETKKELYEKFPEGVAFDAEGYPDFSPYAKEIVEIDMKGNRTSDYDAANEAAGLDEVPEGYTWHHHQDTKTMLLVPTDLHSEVRHSGGVSVIKHQTK